MKRWSKLMVAGLVTGSLVLASYPALAAASGAGINQRQYRQQVRIHQGACANRITPWEFWQLQREQARVRAVEARMKADGRFTRNERARLQHLLNLSSRHIYRAAHDRWVR